MHAHVAEIVAEARLHQAARRLVQLFAACLQHIFDARRRARGSSIGYGPPLNAETLLAAFAARAREASRRAASTLLLR
jgi:hypothetical protein